VQLINDHAMKKYEVVEVTPFLTSALHEGEWSASCPGHFTNGEGTPSSHWIGGWVGPRVSLDAVEKRKSLAPARDRTLAVQPVAHCYTD
jgi:hypothetical protein